jgi:transcriptional regulator with XRE-family HTH domain
MATSGVTPSVARRRLRLALREAREASELTQLQVADAMEWSHSKVIRIENGEVTISPNDLRPLLAYLGITERATVDGLIQDARTARSRKRQMWYEEPRMREHLSPAMRHLIEYEAEATSFRYFYTFVFPGFFQTQEYARAVLNKYRDRFTEDGLEARLEARQWRRRDFLARRDKPQTFVLLDVSVLYREIGGAQVLRDQLVDLLKQAEAGRLVVRVMPYSLDAPPPTFGTFDLLDLGGEGESDAIMYREVYVADEIIEDRAKIVEHRELFDQLWDSSDDEKASRRHIADHIDALTSSLRTGAATPVTLRDASTPTRS